MRLFQTLLLLKKEESMDNKSIKGSKHLRFAMESLRRRCMTFADCRPQTADCRPQIADCKLKDTKNLPNKGDTIKNITSCESEKVAWEQG